MLDQQDRLRHRISGAFARESIAYCIPLPEEGLLALLYTWVNAQDEAGYAFAIYAQGPDMAYFQHMDGIPVSRRDFDDWEVEGLRVQVGADLGSARASYRDDAVSVEVTFTALHEAFDYAQNRGGCPAWQATNRYEQSGHLRGTLRWNDRVITIDHPGHRDHSWGRRDWDALHHYKWFAIAGQDRASNLMIALVEGETIVNGYVYLDGLLAPVVSADVQTRYSEDYAQEVIDAQVTDEAGRVTAMRFPSRFSFGRWDISPTVNFTDGCFSGDIAGGPVSAYIQYVWPRAYLDHLLTRGHPTPANSHAPAQGHRAPEEQS